MSERGTSMEDKKSFESIEEEPFELNDEELENIAGGIEVPPPLAPPAPIGEAPQDNCPKKVVFHAIYIYIGYE